MTREHFSALGTADISFTVTLLDASVSRRQRQHMADLIARALHEDLAFEYTTGDASTAPSAWIASTAPPSHLAHACGHAWPQERVTLCMLH